MSTQANPPSTLTSDLESLIVGLGLPVTTKPNRQTFGRAVDWYNLAVGWMIYTTRGAITLRSAGTGEAIDRDAIAGELVIVVIDGTSQTALVDSALVSSVEAGKPFDAIYYPVRIA